MPSKITEKIRNIPLNQPIGRWLMASFLVVALVPLIIVGYKVYEAAWENAWREIREKHQLLAQNLAAPISTYLNDHRAALSLLSSSLESIGAHNNHARARTLMTETLLKFPGYRSLSLLDDQGRIIITTENNLAKTGGMQYAKERCYLRTRTNAIWVLSGMKRSPLSGQPTIIMSQPAGLKADGTSRRVLMAEMRIDFIEHLRAGIRFGRRGHSAIVDQHGVVVAHPNPDWMKSMKDLSHLNVVKKMMAGHTGVIEFYSPFVKKHMVAGYTSAPGIGWGIMVPQPKEEVEEQVNGLLWSQLGWGAIGLLLAGVIGLMLVRWITRPINNLAHSAAELQRNGFEGELIEEDETAPREIRQLNLSFGRVVKGLQNLRALHDELNQSLQERVDEATTELRDANQKLDNLVKIDYLTALSNRRHLEAMLTTSLNRRADDHSPLCLLFIDIDHFKSVNDNFGHAAGDAVLIKIAEVLRKSTRHGDVVARYGGDEFVVIMRLEWVIAQQRAQAILKEIERSEFVWRGNKIEITASIGLFYHDPSYDISCDELLQQVDKAMYQAKSEGRNRLVEQKLA